MTSRLARWWPHLVAAACLAAAVGFLAVMNMPGPPPELPPGWTLSAQPGATMALAPGPDGLYAGGAGGLVLIAPDGQVTRLAPEGTRGSMVVAALLVDSRAQLWVGHNQGLSVRTPTGWRTLGTADGLPHRYVLALGEAADGFIWAGTADGAVRLPRDGPWTPEAMTVLKRPQGLPHNNVSAVLLDRDGGAWFATRGAPEGGVGRYLDGRWTIWTPRDGLPHANVTSLAATRDGSILAGCGLMDDGGAAVFRPGDDGSWRLAAVLPAAELASPNVRSLMEDSRRRLWIGSETGGLTIRADDATLCVIRPGDAAPSEIMAIAETGDGAVWLGTPAGAVRVPPEGLDAFLVPGREHR